MILLALTISLFFAQFTFGWPCKVFRLYFADLVGCCCPGKAGYLWICGQIVATFMQPIGANMSEFVAKARKNYLVQRHEWDHGPWMKMTQ